MSDFVNSFWDNYVVVIVLASIMFCAVLLKSLSTATPEKIEVTGHVWDDDLEEYNNPLPRWWMYMFYITIFFSIGYLMLYPGLGSYKGLLGWTSVGQLQAEQAKADEKVAPLFDKYMKQDVKAVAADKEGREMGQRLFLTYCSQCHGSDAKGAKGFPNLTDSDWLYGGEPDQIKATINAGRMGMMPAYGGQPDKVGGEAGAKEVANYVRSLSGLKHDAALAEKGKDKFAAVCAACHGADAKGNQAIGAPNLTDKVWLYGSNEKEIVKTIVEGRKNQMPAWKDFLGEAKVHLLTSYVYGLSHQAATQK